MIYFHTKSDMNKDIVSSDCCAMAIGLDYHIHCMRSADSLYVCKTLARLQRYTVYLDSSISVLKNKICNASVCLRIICISLINSVKRKKYGIRKCIHIY